MGFCRDHGQDTQSGRSRLLPGFFDPCQISESSTFPTKALPSPQAPLDTDNRVAVIRNKAFYQNLARGLYRGENRLIEIWMDSGALREHYIPGGTAQVPPTAPHSHQGSA